MKELCSLKIFYGVPSEKKILTTLELIPAEARAFFNAIGGLRPYRKCDAQGEVSVSLVQSDMETDSFSAEKRLEQEPFRAGDLQMTLLAVKELLGDPQAASKILPETGKGKVVIVAPNSFQDNGSAGLGLEFLTGQIVSVHDMYFDEDSVFPPGTIFIGY